MSDVNVAPDELEPATWGPVARGGRRRRRRFVLIAAVVVLLPAVQLLVAALYANNRIDRVEVEGLRTAAGPFHVLIVGSDSRAELTREERVELRTGSAGGERTDTIFVLTLHRGRVGILAFPRDLWVTRCDGTDGRINAAYPLGGPTCLVRTVSDLSGLPIGGFAKIDFGGFRSLVDAVDGVRLCLDDPIKDRDAGIDLPAGCQVLDGKDSLGYVRVRKIDNDLQRIERQQEFLRALAARVATPATALIPTRLFPVAGSAADALTVDQGTGVVDLFRLARAMRTIQTGGMTTATVPTRPTTMGGAAVLLPTEEAASVYAGFASGSALQEQPGVVEPEDIQVTVLNGAGVEGLASRVADHLRALGYQVTAVGNAATTARSVVRHPPGLEAQAARVAQDVPVEVQIEETADVTTVTLVLGTDAAG